MAEDRALIDDIADELAEQALNFGAEACYEALDRALEDRGIAVPRRPE